MTLRKTIIEKNVGRNYKRHKNTNYYEVLSENEKDEDVPCYTLEKETSEEYKGKMRNLGIKLPTK